MDSLRLLIAVCVSMAVFAQDSTQQLNSSTADYSCFDDYNTCFQTSFGTLFYGPNNTQLSYDQVNINLKDTPIEEQCRLRREETQCQSALIEGSSCPEIEEIVGYSQFLYQFQCVDNFNDSAKYFKCATDTYGTEGSNDCTNKHQYSDDCNVEAYSQCMDRVTDSMNTTDCNVPGRKAGVKAYDRKLTKKMDENNLFCHGGPRK